MIVFCNIQKVPKMPKMPKAPKILEGFQSVFNLGIFAHLSSLQAFVAYEHLDHFSELKLLE